MTVDSLRTELGKRKLSTEGSKDALQDRLHASDEQELKRVKTVMNSVADEYLCPITQELPIEPVMAEDGKFYERWAIEEWLGKQQRSPSTGVAMGRRLTPVTQVRNTISQLVESGAIDGDKAIACATTPRHHATLATHVCHATTQLEGEAQGREARQGAAYEGGGGRPLRNVPSRLWPERWGSART